MSGLIRNALDYTEDMKLDERLYFDERADVARGDLEPNRSSSCVAASVQLATHKETTQTEAGFC